MGLTAPLMVLLLASAASTGIAAGICPSVHSIYPCKCISTVLGLRVMCSGIRSPRALTLPFDILAKYPIHTLAMRNINFSITVDLFSGLNLVSIKILNSVYRVSEVTNKAHSTFLNLEEKLEVLEVSHTTLDFGNTNLGAMRRLSKMSIGDSSVDVLRKGWFDGLSDLRTFSISNSKLGHVEDEALSGLANVDIIELRSCHLGLIHRNYFPPIAYKLEELDLSDNKLSWLPDNLFTNMPHLQTVVLSRNAFKVLSPKPWTNWLGQLSKLNLEGNPIVCNHTISWLLRAELKGKVVGRCAEPMELVGMSLADLDDLRYSGRIPRQKYVNERHDGVLDSVGKETASRNYLLKVIQYNNTTQSISNKNTE
uniref:Putative membrane glycoprotein lig-1 n=1 Tax=Ixodes ricinus TaxID=34613 RepID=V5GIS3_IXORI